MCPLIRMQMSLCPWSSRTFRNVRTKTPSSYVQPKSADGLEGACQKEPPSEPKFAKANRTNEDTTTVCCVCESSVPCTPLTFDFCASCSPTTRFFLDLSRACPAEKHCTLLQRRPPCAFCSPTETRGVWCRNHNYRSVHARPLHIVRKPNVQ